MSKLTTGEQTKDPARYLPPLAYVFLGLVLLSTFAIRFHLRNLPLERDEGEYAYAGQLLLEGIPPYQLAYNMKLPGTYFAYALILAAFGQTPAGVHLGLLVVNLITIVLVFFIALRLSGLVGASAAAASYALLSISPSVLGFSGHATHFVVLAASAGILALLAALEKGRLWLFFVAGILLGLAFVMKQPGLMFVVFGGFYLISVQTKHAVDGRALARQVGVFTAGALLPFLLTCLGLWHAGVFNAFWFWTVSYAAQYATNYGIGEGAHLFAAVFPLVVESSLGLWLLAAVGVTAIFWDRESRQHAEFLLGFLLFAFLAVCPGFLFREHYFILLLPAIALLIGVAVSAGTRGLSHRGQPQALRYAPSLILLLALAGCFYRQKNFFLESDGYAVCRRIYGGNPFPEAVIIGDYIRRHTPEDAKIAVLGSEPEIYFYAHRHSATGYIYTYGLMEEQKYALQMQAQMINEIQSARPQVIVFVKVAASWLSQAHSQGLIYSWAQNYIQAQYELSGVADIHMDHTDYRWENDAKNFEPRSNAVVFIFRRRT
jgi:Dolichyl-phosphate-mannose-protein mannosyltransferase